MGPPPRRHQRDSLQPGEQAPLEFVELHNPTEKDIRLEGWSLGKFSFPSNAVIAARGFTVVAQHPDAFTNEFGFQPFGPLPGKLSNHGEKLTLRDARQNVVDEVHSGVGFPGPQRPTARGPRWSAFTLNSHPKIRRRGAARVSRPSHRSRRERSSSSESTGWRWRKGLNEASQPVTAWRLGAFVEDATWQNGQASIGYEDGDDRTVLTDMLGRYTSLFLRHSFVVSGKLPAALLLRVRVDDGCIVWINGREVARFHVRPGEIPFNGVAENHDAGEEFEERLIENAASLLTPGTNLLAIQALNSSLNSSDLTIDAELRTPEGATRGRRPTPGATSSVFSAVAPPPSPTSFMRPPSRSRAKS